MHAMQIHQITRVSESMPRPLQAAELPVPRPSPGELLLKVSACGVCHTELDEIEGRLPPPRLPVTPGHQVVGRVVELGGPRADQEARITNHESRIAYPDPKLGDRLGVAWIYSACGECAHCQAGNENLCATFRATGHAADGGYAEYMLAPAAFTYPIPEIYSDVEAAPLLCAGAIGYRALRVSSLRDGQMLGMTGFGASAHLVLKMVQQRFPQAQVFVFSRSPHEQEFARQLGAAWAGEIGARPPALLDAIIDTTPAWRPIVEALGCLAPGGRLVINAIRKEQADKESLLSLDYPRDLWLEKEIKSVANVTRRDVGEFLQLAAEIPIRPEVQTYPLHDANQALLELKNRKIRGAKVLTLA